MPAAVEQGPGGGAPPADAAGGGGGDEKFGGDATPVAAAMPDHRLPNYTRFCAWGAEYGALAVDPGVERVIRAGPHARRDDNIVHAYTDNAIYAAVNRALYTDSREGLLRFGGYIGELRRVMSARCRGGQNVTAGTLWRGLRLPADFAARLVPGFRFLFPNFVSTTRRREQLRGFNGNVTVEIVMPLGAGVTYALDVARLSRFPREQEVLFYPYSGFEVLERHAGHDGALHVRVRPFDTTLIDTATGGTTPFHKTAAPAP